MARKSRLQITEERKARKRALTYIVISLIVITLIAFYGISLVSRFTDFVLQVAGNETAYEDTNAIRPAPPQLDYIPKTTNKETITVTGKSIPSTQVILYVNSQEFELLVNASGEFTKILNLEEDKSYSIYAVAVKNSIESSPSDTFTIELDKKAPEIEIISPENDIEFLGEKNRNIKIEAKTEPNTRVFVNERVAIVSSDGKFSYSARLEEGVNTFKIVVLDEAGNQTEQEIRYTLDL